MAEKDNRCHVRNQNDSLEEILHYIRNDQKKESLDEIVDFISSERMGQKNIRNPGGWNNG